MPESGPVAPVPADAEEHTLADAHRDIDFGNRYRIEYIKHLISIATAVLVFTVTFMKDFVGKKSSEAEGRFLLLLGWSALVASMVAGIFHMRYWSWYYVSWGTRWKEPTARDWRATVNARRKIAENLQVYGFIIGLLCLMIFAVWNVYV
jgi:hypothetical protein